MYIGNTNCLLLNNICLAVVDEVNDLGVVIDSCLTSHTHIRKNVVRASVRANLIHKCFISRDAFTLIRVFEVYVRPEYLNTPRVHGLLTIFLKYNMSKVYKGNLPSDYLGACHYATRRGCCVLISIAWKCVGCGTICCTLKKLYLT